MPWCLAQAGNISIWNFVVLYWASRNHKYIRNWKVNLVRFPELVSAILKAIRNDPIDELQIYVKIHQDEKKLRFFPSNITHKNSKFLPSSFQKAPGSHSVPVAWEGFPSLKRPMSIHCLQMQSSGWEVEVSLSYFLEFLCWQICPATKRNIHISTKCLQIYLIPKVNTSSTAHYRSSRILSRGIWYCKRLVLYNIGYSTMV